MQYVMPFLLAMIVTMAWLPLLARFASKWRLVDQPGERKVHSTPVPRIGGVAMATGVMVAGLLAIDLQPSDRWFLAAAAVLVTFGALDDRFDLDYRLKFVGQFVAVAIVVLFGGVRIFAITLDDRVLLPEWISIPLTVFFLIGITNAINLADGLDGLAGGTTFMCLCAVALFSSVGEQGSSAALSLAFAGAVLGFLRFNTYPASVFMGDAGSQLLGFTVGVLSIRATQNLTSQVSAAIPILLLAIPILDTLSVMVQRVSEGRSPFSADKNHIHHKLLALGFGHHEAVMVIYALQALLFVIAYLLRFESDLTILAVVSGFFVASILLLQLASRSGWRPRGTGPAVDSALSRWLLALQQPERLPRISYLAIAAALTAYAALTVCKVAALNRDFRMLIIALLAVAIGSFAYLKTRRLSLLERAALYVTATILVYFDAVGRSADGIFDALTWIAVGVAAVALAVRLRMQNERRFRVTPLDLIVLFMALIVPSLPGVFRLPHGSALAIAKLFVLFYSIEIVVGGAERAALWVRIALVAILSLLVARPLLIA